MASYFRTVKLTADFRKLKVTKAQKGLIAALAASELASRTRFIRHESAVLNALLKAAGEADSASLKLAKDAGSTTLEAQLQNDIANGQSAAEDIGQSLQAPMVIALADASRLMTDAAS